MLKVLITSHNPIKIEASRAAFTTIFPKEKFSFQSLAVASLVSDQPFGQKETYQGALNRVNNAKQQVEADYYVGIEGGIEIINDELECFAWMVIWHNNILGKAKTGSFFLPKKLAKLVKEGLELGEATDLVFNSQNAKQSGGAVGYLTGQALSRAKFYQPAIMMALIPFKNPDLY